MIEFDGETLKTKDGIFQWSKLRRVMALSRDRLTLHDIYYQLYFGEKSTIIFEEDEGFSPVYQVMINLPNFAEELHLKIFRAEITEGDFLLYEKFE